MDTIYIKEALSGLIRASHGVIVYMDIQQSLYIELQEIIYKARISSYKAV